MAWLGGRDNAELGIRNALIRRPGRRINAECGIRNQELGRRGEYEVAALTFVSAGLKGEIAGKVIG